MSLLVDAGSLGLVFLAPLGSHTDAAGCLQDACKAPSTVKGIDPSEIHTSVEQCVAICHRCNNNVCIKICICVYIYVYVYKDRYT